MSDYIFLLESRLTPVQRELVSLVETAANKAQLHLFLAGGAVRDLLAKTPAIHDLDFAVEGNALKLVKQLDRTLFIIRDLDEHRGSAEVVFRGAATAEIAMCRRESYTKTGARPEVNAAGIQEDLRRRDFSVNAIALSLNPTSKGLLLDPTNGIADIEAKELRALHNTCFYDDPSRLLRLVRLAARLKYGIEAKTKTQFSSAREAGVAEYVQPHARLVELRALAAEPDWVEAVKALASANLLEVFEPHLPRKLDLPSLNRLDKCRRVMLGSGILADYSGPFLWVLTRKLSAAEKKALQARSGMKAADARTWAELERHAKAVQRLITGKQAATYSGLYRTLEAQDPRAVLLLYAFSPLQPVREKIKNYLTNLRPLAQSVTDRDVEELGVKRDSAKFAAVREAYVAARLDKKIRDKADAAKVLKAIL